MERIKQTISSLTKGINKDLDVFNTDKEYRTFTLNGITDSIDGSDASIQSEPGNLPVHQERGYKTIGAIYGNGETYIFSTNGETSKILIQKEGVTQEVIVSDCLGFEECTYIQGQFRVKNGCDRIIYWNDCENPDRRINLDKLHQYRDEEGNWDCNLMSLNPDVSPVCIDAELVQSGGKLRLGNYYAIVELLDDNLNVIYKSLEAPYISVYDRVGFNLDNTDTLLGGLPPVNTSIKYTVSNVGNYSYARMNFIIATTGDGLTTTAIRKPELIPIGSDTFTYTLKGFDSNDQDISVGELTIPLVKYKTSCHMEQVQRRLLRADIKENKYDYAEFQKAASKITTKWVSKEVKAEDQVQTFQGDEIYPFSIGYITKEGNKLPPFHIPGRAANIYNPLDQLDGFVLDNVINAFTYCLVLNIKNNTNIIQETTYEINFDTQGESISLLESATLDPLSEEEFQVYCTQDEFTNIQTNFENNNELTFSYTIEEVASDPDLFIYNNNGWDNTVYPEWIEDLAPWYTKEQYEELISNETTIEEITNLVNKNYIPKRWEVFNTAYKIRSYKGGMAYHECENTYPSFNCEEDYWGEDHWGNKLTGTPIRHHRFPCRTLIPVEGKEGYVNQLGIEFDNIEYPHEDIVGHYILVGNRDEENKTVLESGISGRLRTSQDFTKDANGNFDDCEIDFQSNNAAVFNYYELFEESFGQGIGNPDFAELPWSYVITPTGLVNKQYPRGEYLKTNYIKSRESKKVCQLTSGDGKFLQFNDSDTDLRFRNRNITYRNLRQTPSQFNYNIEESAVVSPTAYVEAENTSLFNLSSAMPMHFHRTNRRMDISPKQLHYVYIKNTNYNVYCELDSVSYRQLGNCISEEGDVNSFYDGDTFISELDPLNYMFTRVGDGVLDTIAIALVVVAATLLTIATAGIATPLAAAMVIAVAAVGTIYAYGQAIGELIAKDTFKKFFQDDDGDNFYRLFNLDLNGETKFGSEHIKGFYVESPINMNLVHTSPDPILSHYSGSSSQNLLTHVRDKVARFEEDENNENKNTFRFRADGILPEGYLYNADFSRLNIDTPCFPLSYNYDHCSSCNGEFKNKIVYSRLSLDEEIQDTFVTNLANDFIDIPANRGPITELKYIGSNLLIHTEKSTFVINPNPQVLQATGSDVFVGNGSFLSIPPIELRNTGYGYAGKQGRFASTMTDFGYVWADDNRGEIFTFDNQLDILSEKGLQQWFKENSHGESRLGFDPRFKRLLITNKSECESNVCKDWTLSYSPYFNWISWHSYIPDFYYNDSTHYYSVLNGTWQHQHNNNFQTYYGRKYDFIVEYVSPTMITDDLHTIHYVARTEKWDDTHSKWIQTPEITFDRLMAYNSCQSTGLQDIEYINQITNPYGNLNDKVTVINTDKNYKIANIWDYSIGQPILTSNCEFINEPIDCVSFDENIDYDKSPYDKGPLKDKWIKTRLYFNPEEDVKKIINLINNNNYISIR